MGTFFLLGGTFFFLVGLGALIVVFSSIVTRLKSHQATTVYFKKKSNIRNGILTGTAIALIVLSQGFYWFNGEVSRFLVFEDTVPQVKAGFIYQQFRTPRVIIKGNDNNNVVSLQAIPLVGDKIYIGSEVITWKKVFSILGLKDCYQVTGIYYGSDDPDWTADPNSPDYRLNGGPSELFSLISTLGAIFPAEAKFYLTPALDADPQLEYTVHISTDSTYLLQSIDNGFIVDYSY